MSWVCNYDSSPVGSEKIMITKHGVPVAMLVPLPSAETPDVARVMSDVKKFRRKLSLKGA